MLAVNVSESSATFAARRAATNLAAELGFNETDAGKLAIVVTEMATNLLKHAGSGQILLDASSQPGGAAVEVIAIDSGPGMSNPQNCMVDGYSSAGSNGTGLGAISRLSKASEIYTVPGHGTIVRALCVAGQVATQHLSTLDVAGISVPIPNETECGDAFAIRETDAGTLLMVSDGLGHGPIAADASRTAVRAFQKLTTTDVTAVLQSIHDAMRGTRGAAVAIALLDTKKNLIRYCGAGNIVGALIEGDSIRHFVSMHGIVGHQIRTPRAFDYPWNRNAVVAMHSDGISSHWNLSTLPGITNRSAVMIAGAVYRAARRRSDDATILVAKAR